ncbi:MAG TPA: MATE family efflux transporter, partial [Gemmatimonadaceae bacterium]|nr:MATE family efflux transporter [Gemmatimonadaceae bacterium]
PPELDPAAALPLDPRDGLMAVAVTGEYAANLAITRGALPRAIAVFALPAVASMLLMTLFYSADAFWVGQKIGAAGLAAVSTSVFWIWMIISGADMVSVGLTAVASRRHGEGRPGDAARAVGDAVVYALVIGLAIAVFGRISLQGMFAVMDTPPEVTALGVDYLGTYLLGAPLIFGFFAVDAAFRASGDTRTPFLLLVTTVIAALVLDPVLIMGLGPAPRLGIAGAAVATIATRAVAFVFGVALLVRRRMIRVGRVDVRTLARISRVGLPTAVTGIVFAVVYVLLTRTTTRFGTPALAALGVGQRVESWTFMIGVGFGAAAAAIVGQNLGARQPERAALAGWIATGFASLVCAIGAMFEFTMAPQFTGLFSSDPAVVAEGAHYLRIVAVSTLFSGSELVLEGALGGAGETLPPMLTSSTLTVLRLPIAAWAATRWGTAGIWWTISITGLGRGVAMMTLWRWGRWKRKSL